MYVVLEYVHKDSEETRGSELDAVSVGMMHRVGVKGEVAKPRITNELLFYTSLLCLS